MTLRQNITQRAFKVPAKVLTFKGFVITSDISEFLKTEHYSLSDPWPASFMS